MEVENGRPGRLMVLTLAAIGVVYGDIGTSPLYALRECFGEGPHAIPVNPTNVLGILSLVFWVLVLIISIKYIGFVLRADNRGEGGILALLALTRPRKGEGRMRRAAVVSLGLFGAALLYGDGVITPAISVLSAVEGLKLAAPQLGSYVITLTIGILAALFFFQSQGTARVGAVFGPVMVTWFTVISVLGVRGILIHPAVFAAMNPAYAVKFFLAEPWLAFVSLGSVFLVVTGGEALYADMGHFGRRPIRLAWFSMVFPALILNYFGQGALLLSDPKAAENPFYRLAPGWALYPLIGLATAAAVIASQAVISGAFSLTRQAVLLGYSPRLEIEHTSSEEIGQIYIPAVNWTLAAATIALVLWFGSSSKLAAAYGIAVTTTMVITALLAYTVARTRWGWSRAKALPIMLAFLVVDLAFFSANALKIAHGGWLPLVGGGFVFLLMSTWKRGREILMDRMRDQSLPLEVLLEDLDNRGIHRVKGTAVFMTGKAERTPAALLHHLKHNQVLHEHVVLLTIRTEEVPRVPEEERIEVAELEHGFFVISAHVGFTEDPNVPEILKLCEKHGVSVDPGRISYFLGRETLIPSKRPGMALWREKLFALMARNATPASNYFRLPPGRVVELGVQIEL